MTTGTSRKRWRVKPAARLSGSVRIPGDKSIGHRSLLLGALAEGESRVTGLSGGLDNRATAAAMRAMGAGIEETSEDGSEVTIRGVGLRGLTMPTEALDCGNSGTSMRLLAGLLVAQRFGSRLVGDHSLSGRPMMRIVGPLRARGGHIAGVSGDKEGEVYPPLSIAPLVEGETLKGIEYEMPVASAQVKSALLLSGLYASGPTALKEPTLSRDHTERMLVALGVPLQTMGPMVLLDPNELPWRVGMPSTGACRATSRARPSWWSRRHVVKGSELAPRGGGDEPDPHRDPRRAPSPCGSHPEVQRKDTGAGDEPTARPDPGQPTALERRKRGR